MMFHSVGAGWDRSYWMGGFALISIFGPEVHYEITHAYRSMTIESFLYWNCIFPPLTCLVVGEICSPFPYRFFHSVGSFSRMISGQMRLSTKPVSFSRSHEYLINPFPFPPPSTPQDPSCDYPS